MVIGQVVVVVHQHTGIGVLFDGSTQGVAHRQFNVGVGRNQCAVIDNERLSGLVVNQPVQEILGGLTLGIGGVVGGVDEEVLGAAAHQLFVGAVTGVVGNRHHAHVLGVIKGVDHGPVPVAAEHHGDLALSQLLLGNLTLGRDGGILGVVVGHQHIEGVHHFIELGIGSQVDGAILDTGNVGIGIVMLLIDLCQEVCAQRPVFLHNAGRSGHTAGNQGIHQVFQILGGLDGAGVEGLSGGLLYGIGVVENAPGFHTHGETVNLAVNGDGLGGVLDPVLAAQIHGVLGSQRVDVFGVYHGQGVGIVGSVAGGQMCGDRVIGVVDFNAHALFFGVLGSGLFQLTLDLHFGVEDGDGYLVAFGIAAAAAGGQSQNQCQGQNQCK